MMKAGIYWVGDLCYVLDGKDIINGIRFVISSLKVEMANIF